MQTEAEKRKLFCWHETEIHPFYKIGPIKLELLSMRPKMEVLIFHDVLGQTGLSFLLNSTNLEFYTSSTFGGSNPIVRLSSVAWVLLDRSPEGRRILKMISSMTGLIVERVDGHAAIQIASYTPGCHYSSHPDTVS